MIKILKEDSNSVMKSRYFELVTISGIGVSNTPYSGYKVISNEVANDFNVEIRLNSKNQDFNGEPIEFEYYESYISYGQQRNTRQGSLSSIREFIEILNDAMKFKVKIDQYLNIKN